MSRKFTRRCHVPMKCECRKVLVLVGDDAQLRLVVIWGPVVDADSIRQALRLDVRTPILYEIVQ